MYVINFVVFINMYLTLVIYLFIGTQQSQTLCLDLGTTRQVPSRAIMFALQSSFLLIGGRVSGAEKLSPARCPHLPSKEANDAIQFGSAGRPSLFSKEPLTVNSDLRVVFTSHRGCERLGGG